MTSTKIEWADATINPIVGCSKCSPGCDNCYAERGAARMAKHLNAKISGKYSQVVNASGKWNGRTATAFEGWESSDHLHDWMLAALPRKPSRIFVGSMGDVFHETVEQEWLEAIWEVMRQSPQHTFMLLTKREKKLYEYAHLLQPRPQPLPNVWLGVTVCNQEEANAKIPVLLNIPAAKRFISIEPMLGPVDLYKIPAALHIIPGAVVHWVICGGETGPNARPMHPGWVRSLRDHCAAFNGPFFFKGWGEWEPREWRRDGATHAVREDDGILHRFAHSPTSQDRAETASEGWHALARVGKSRSGRLLDGIEYNEFPEEVC